MACKGVLPPPPVGAGPGGPRDPWRAVVIPRACAAPDGEPLPLHDHIRRLLDRRAKGVVNVFGPRGSGKSTALRHLAAVLPRDAHLLFLDDDNSPTLAGAAARDCLVVLSTRARTGQSHLAAFRMAPWTADDAIEYLLATCPDRCASVMARLKDSPADAAAATGGTPELWRIVLDQMVASDAVATPVEALRHVLASRLGDESVRRQASGYCVQQLVGASSNDAEDLLDPPSQFDDPVLARVLGHQPIQVLLAAQRIVWDIAEGRGRDHLHRRLPGELLREVASLASFREPVMNELRWIVQDGCDPRAHPAAASILHATNIGWRPEGKTSKLCCARLEGAKWAGVDLFEADLGAAHLAGSVLDKAKLDDANLSSADLTAASLRGASLRSLRAANAVLAHADLSAAVAPSADFTAADLRHADFSAADLHGAKFVRCDLGAAKLRNANLRSAEFQEAELDGTDLCGADLTGASLARVRLGRVVLRAALFRGARLGECDLRGLELRDAVFRDAIFSGCDFARSTLRGADFRGAAFPSTGLADVRWEGADLRGADLTRASFHTGSSRSGLVGSTIASEGTRTGFYTDDYDDRSYKPPEEIRKATLCRADLRGAKVEETDFYLVDLRGARYSPGQARHFRQCGAIL